MNEAQPTPGRNPADHPYDAMGSFPRRPIQVVLDPLPPPPPPVSSKRRWPMIILLTIASIVAVALILALSTSGDSNSIGASVGENFDQQVIHGTMTLIDTDIAGDWDDCYGTGGYDDFGAGMNVTVRNGDGTIIGSVDARNLTSADPDAAEARDLEYFCTIAFDVDVEAAEFYTVEAGHRGELSYSAKEMADEDWTVALSLGSVEDLFDD
jgi:hypothetical protein